MGDEVLELLGKQSRQSRALSSTATSGCSPGPRTGIIPVRGEWGRVLAPLQDQGTWWPGVAWLGCPLPPPMGVKQRGWVEQGSDFRVLPRDLSLPSSPRNEGAEKKSVGLEWGKEP